MATDDGATWRDDPPAAETMPIGPIGMDDLDSLFEIDAPATAAPDAAPALADTGVSVLEDAPEADAPALVDESSEREPDAAERAPARSDAHDAAHDAAPDDLPVDAERLEEAWDAMVAGTGTLVDLVAMVREAAPAWSLEDALRFLDDARAEGQPGLSAETPVSAPVDPAVALSDAPDADAPALVDEFSDGEPDALDLAPALQDAPEATSEPEPDALDLALTQPDAPEPDALDLADEFSDGEPDALDLAPALQDAPEAEPETEAEPAAAAEADNTAPDDLPLPDTADLELATTDDPGEPRDDTDWTAWAASLDNDAATTDADAEPELDDLSLIDEFADADLSGDAAEPGAEMGVSAPLLDVSYLDTIDVSLDDDEEPTDAPAADAPALDDAALTLSDVPEPDADTPAPVDAFSDGEPDAPALGDAALTLSDAPEPDAPVDAFSDGELDALALGDAALTLSDAPEPDAPALGDAFSDGEPDALDLAPVQPDAPEPEPIAAAAPSIAQALRTAKANGAGTMDLARRLMAHDPSLSLAQAIRAVPGYLRQDAPTAAAETPVSAPVDRAPAQPEPDAPALGDAALTLSDAPEPDAPALGDAFSDDESDAPALGDAALTLSDAPEPDAPALGDAFSDDESDALDLTPAHQEAPAADSITARLEATIQQATAEEATTILAAFANGARRKGLLQQLPEAQHGRVDQLLIAQGLLDLNGARDEAIAYLLHPEGDLPEPVIALATRYTGRRNVGTARTMALRMADALHAILEPCHAK